MSHIIQARIDSYNATTGYVNFTNIWKGASTRGCLRVIEIESGHKKRHNGPHAVGIQLAKAKSWCTGDIAQLSDEAAPACGTPDFFYNLELSAYPCASSACSLLVGEYTGTATVRAAITGSCPTGSPYSLSPSYIKIYNVTGRLSTFGFVKGPIEVYDQPIPMTIRSFDSGTGQLLVQTFYSTQQCMTLNVTRLANGNFWASVPVGGNATFFSMCPAAGTGVTGCEIGTYDFSRPAPVAAPVATPVASPVAGVPTTSAPGATTAPRSAASAVEIIVAYLTIAVVAVALLVLQ